jgi:peptidyl-prolyl cis-trans isomerase D
MLSKIRTELKGITKVLMWAVVISFVGTIIFEWGMRVTGRKGAYPDEIARVNKKSIRFGELKQKYQELAFSYGKNFPRERLLEIAIDSLIREKLLLEKAEQLQIHASPQEIVEEVKKLPLFQEEGKFSQEKYNEALQNKDFNWEALTRQIKKSIILTKLENFLSDSVLVLPTEVKAAFEDKNKKVLFKYLHFQPEKYKEKVSFNEKELKEYYQTHQKEYVTPLRIKVKYFLIKKEELTKNIRVNITELEKYYHENKEEFEKPEEIQYQEIVVKKASREKAQKVLDEALKATDFSAFGKKIASRKKGIEFQTSPWVKKGDAPAAIEDIVFLLEKEEVHPELIKTSEGYHIIKLIARRPPQLKPFGEVKEEIHQKLAPEKAEELAQVKSQELYRKLKRAKGNKIEEIVKEFRKSCPVSVKETDFFSEDESIKGLGWVPEFNKACFGLKKLGAITKVIKTWQGYLIGQLLEKKPPYLPPLEEIREKIEKKLKDEKLQALIKEEAEKVYRELKQGASFKKIAKKYSLASGEIKEPVAKNDYLPEIGRVKEVSYRALTLKENTISEPIFTENKGAYIIKLTKLIQPQEDEFKQRREKLQEQLKREKRYRFLYELKEYLEKKAKIVKFWPPKKG